MRCEKCQGSGTIEVAIPVPKFQSTFDNPAPLTFECRVEKRPCPECGGCGVAHCCDGLIACGEISDG